MTAVMSKHFYPGARVGGTDDDHRRVGAVETSFRIVHELGGTRRVSQRDRGIFDHAKQEIHALADELDEVVDLTVEEGGTGVYIYSVGGTDAVNIDTSVGRCVSLHSTALGEAILAFMNRERDEPLSAPRRDERHRGERELLLTGLLWVNLELELSSFAPSMSYRSLLPVGVDGLRFTRGVALPADWLDSPPGNPVVTPCRQ